jgi:predicted nuclease of predicted toxin-antitoxin system
MLRLLIDQDCDHDILRGLRLRVPTLNAVTAREACLDRKSDPEVLAWAATERRIVVTHDRNTMTRFAHDRVREGQPMPGIFVVSREMPVGKAIADLQLLLECSEESEWDGLVVFLPF